jgi:transposase
MQRHGLTDREWAQLEPLMPSRPRTGRPPKGHRLILDALLWLGKTGAPWRDLPERFGPWQTVATRFYRWTRLALWERILAELRKIADGKGGVDWEVHLVDGTSVRAHRCATGGKGGGCARRWAAAAAASAASCTCAATAVAGRWRSC